MNKMIKLLLLLLISWTTYLGAELRLELHEVNGATVFERNRDYDVVVQVVPDGSTTIGAIGEIYLEYDQNVFASVTSILTDYHSLPSAIWESEKVSFNHQFATGGTFRAIEYAKTDNNGPFWTINSTANIFTIRLRVRPDAVIGSTAIRFIYLADNSRTKMINSVGSVIPVSVADLNLVIDLDLTAPITIINFPGGLFNSIPDVKLKPDEDALVHYIVVGGSNIWESQLVSEDLFSNTIVIPGSSGQVKYSTLQFYAEDFAQDRAHNTESIQLYLFTVDMADPVISNILVPTQNIPIGATVEVQFDLFDQVGIGSVVVTIGGKAATFISGSGNGSYIYRRQIDGTESGGSLSITVQDTAGNNTNDATQTVNLDFGGPDFINITTIPSTPQINQEVIISFSATELLRENPIVQIGDNFFGLCHA